MSESIPNLLLPHKRVVENTRESQVLLWIWNILQEISEYDYEQYLRDGVVLCRLMNAVNKGSIPEPIVAGDNNKQKRLNIENFLKSCTTYGVSSDMLFNVDDLLLLQNIPKVTRCIFALGKLASEKFDGPELGDEPYEPLDPKSLRRAGMPFGDDIYVAHVNTKDIKKM
ncbi:muscle-specific protein 20-like, partial [Oppia nitens]|uniref:muscle-specific protein 20-like n=1 Tax=Oppia nitens TaxID=1686743 RepID=UPI0023DB52D5